MYLGKTEFDILENISNNTFLINDIVKNVDKSRSQIYKGINSLLNQRIIKKENRSLHVLDIPHIKLLLIIIQKHPHLKSLFSYSGILILSAFLFEKSIKDAAKQVGLKETLIYKIVQYAKNSSILLKDGNTYIINSKIWPDIKEFLDEYVEYESIVDKRVPENSVIFHKTNQVILFSNKRIVDATPTAFSVFENFGIMIFNTANYFVLPKQTLSAKQVLIHSCLIAEKENSIQDIILIALFYAKNKKKLGMIDHPIIKNILKVFGHEKISGYPALSEIEERAKIYGISLEVKNVN